MPLKKFRENRRLKDIRFNLIRLNDCYLTMGLSGKIVLGENLYSPSFISLAMPEDFEIVIQVIKGCESLKT